MDESAYWRTELASLVSKVPASINAASIQTVREYKKVVVKARKALDGRNTQTSLLQGLANHLKSF
jgi:hypothetical protein